MYNKNKLAPDPSKKFQMISANANQEENQTNVTHIFPRRFVIVRSCDFCRVTRFVMQTVTRQHVFPATGRSERVTTFLVLVFRLDGDAKVKSQPSYSRVLRKSVGFQKIVLQNRLMVVKAYYIFPTVDEIVSVFDS